MATMKPKWVATSLAQEFESEDFVALSEAVALHIVTKVTISSEEAAEFAEAHLAEILRHLNEYRISLQEDGIEPLFQVEGDVTEAYIRAEAGAAKLLRTRMFSMDPIAFEELCKRLLLAIGAKEGTRVGQSGDQGVDFVARELQLVVPASVGARIHIVGQAKRYALHNQVGDRELREFVGGAIKRIADPLDTIVYRPERLAPVIYAFWTTGEFSSSALAYAKAVGLWHLNGLGLAQLIIKTGLDTSGL